MRQDGYCLTELVLTATVIAILVTALLPIYAGCQKIVYEMELDAAAKRIASDIRWVQQAAFNQGVSHLYQLYFKKGLPGYYIIDRLTLLQEIDFKEHFPCIQLVTCPECISFTVNGTPLYSGTVLIRHRKNPQSLREITVIPATGRVMIK